jgi:hypothetical protein
MEQKKLWKVPAKLALLHVLHPSGGLLGRVAFKQLVSKLNLT